MAQDLPNASRQETQTSSGYSGAHGGTVAMFGGMAWGGDAIVVPGDGSDHTVVQGEMIIQADTSSSTATITLSDAIAAEEGYVVIVNDSGGNAATNNITITAETDTSHNVDGSNQDLTLATNFGEERIFSDGTDFWTW